MKTVEELRQAIDLALSVARNSYDDMTGETHPIRVVLERDFAANTDEEGNIVLGPLDPNTIFFVIRVGRGEHNFALQSFPISVDVISEENSMAACQSIIRTFVNNVNYKYESGLIQTWFMPTVVSPMNEVNVGYRALIEMTGKLYDFEDVTSVVTELNIDNQDIPFINITFGWNAQPDPQSFPNNYGATHALNRQFTRTLTVVTYMWTSASASTDPKQTFAYKVKNALNSGMNTKFAIKLKCNDGQDLANATWIISGYQYGQALGTPSTCAITFTEAEPVATPTSNG